MTQTPVLILNQQFSRAYYAIFLFFFGEGVTLDCRTLLNTYFLLTKFNIVKSQLGNVNERMI